MWVLREAALHQQQLRGKHMIRWSLSVLHARSAGRKRAQTSSQTGAGEGENKAAGTKSVTEISLTCRLRYHHIDHLIDYHIIIS